MRTAFLSLAAVAALAGSAGAHGLRTAFVEVTEIQPGHAVVHLRMNTPDPSIAVTSPDGDCALDATGDGGSVYDKTWLLECPDGLGGRSLALAGLGPIVGEGVVWIARADGTTASQIVRADAPGFALGRAAAPSALAVARQYIALGLEHILTGYDHLLFLLLLVLVLGEVRSVFLAETAFTLSHSLSFSATALGWIRVSAPAAETCIALSLVLLAAEVRTDAAPRRWRGAFTALLFGFVHGLGFAAGLREIGLPERAIGAALVSFGAGIELGQVAFLAIVLGALHLVRHATLLGRVKLGATYAIGGLSAYWVLARALVCFGA